MHDAGRADDVAGDDRVLGVVEVALQRALGGRLERRVDLVAWSPRGFSSTVRSVDRAVGHRHAHREAVELALELRQHQRRWPWRRRWWSG